MSSSDVQRAPTACAACGTALPDGANFCFACGRPVHVPEARARRDPAALRAYTPQHLIDKILTARRALEGERKQVTVLFADVKGSMELAEQVDPEEWHGIMDVFFAILADGVHRFEGTVNQFTGDGIMALFGAPIAHEDHAQRACHAALVLREALRGYAHQLRRERGLDFAVRIGLNSGAVVVGRIGDDLRMDYTAQGHTVGLASRMEQLAEAGSVYVTEHTAALATGFFRFADLGVFTVKGVREPLRVYALEDVGTLRTRFDLSRVRGFSRFVGRDDERQTLEDALRRAADGAAPIVGLVAEPGTGKSRLAFEFASACRGRGIVVVEAHGLAHARRLPFLPARELLRHLFGIADEDPSRVAREKIAGRLLLIDVALRDVLPLLFDFLGIAAADQPPLAVDADLRQQRLVEVARRVITASDPPQLLLWEDLHWLDEASEAFVRALVTALADTCALVLLSFRPEYERGWLPAARYRELALPPLDATASAALLDDLLGTDPALRELAASIQVRTGGNPFFIEETVNALVEHGALGGVRGAYRLLKPVESLLIPATVEAVLAGRLDRLGEPGKEVLQTAAVIGRQFGTALLQAATGIPARELRAVLRALVDADFIHADAAVPAQFAFKHPLTQEVAEHSQLAERRAARHAAVARATEALAAERLNERAALLAHHWERAGDRVAAARWHGRAAEWLGGGDPRTALEHWRRARALLLDEPPGAERDRVLLTAYTQIIEIGAVMAERTEDPAALYDEAHALAERVADPSLTGRLLATYATTVALGGNAMRGLAFVDEAESLAESAGDLELRVIVALAAVNLYDWMGRYAEALAVCERALALLAAHPELGGAGRRGRLLQAKGAALGALGRLGDEAQLLQEAQALAERTNDIELRGFVALESLWLEYMRGDITAAQAHADTALRLGQQLGSGAIVGPTLTLLGALHCTMGRWDDAIGILEMIADRVRLGRLTFEPIVRTFLAEAYLGAGDPLRARVTAEGALAAAQQRGTRSFEARAYMALARVLLHTEGAAARQQLEAIFAAIDALIAETGALSFEAHMRLDRAELARLLGDRAAWEHDLNAARTQFVAMDAPKMVAKVDALLGAGC